MRKVTFFVVVYIIQWIYNAITGAHADFMGYGLILGLILGFLAVGFSGDDDE